MSAPSQPARRWFDLSRFHSLGSVLEEATFRSRSNPFLIETDRGQVVERLTYRAFRAEAGRLASALGDRGVGPESRVAILQANGPRWLMTAYAVLRLGGVVVPLDARLEPAGQARLLRHSGARTLLVDGPAWRRLKDDPVAADLETVVVSRPISDLGQAIEWPTFLAQGQADAPDCAARRRDDLAAIVYSSGTGGRPKGCLLTHGNYLSQMEALGNLYPMEEDEVYLSILPTNHALDFMCGFLVPSLCGASIVHLRTLRPEWIQAACRDHGVSHMSAVPAILEAFARAIRERLDAVEGVAKKGLGAIQRLNTLLTGRRPNHRVSRALLAPVHRRFGGRLRRIFAGGAFVPPETARALYEVGFPVAIGYGLTEACAVVTVNDLDPFRADTVGVPVAGTEVRLDGRDDEGRGEVLVRGPQVFAGYLDDPALSAATLDADGWLRTGDLGVFDATGHLRLVGRLKDMIVTAGGKNVYPEDVEGSFHGLACEELAVVASHRIWPSRPGEDESLVLAVRTRGDDLAPLLAEVSRRNRRLPAHKRLAGVLVQRQPFPRTTSLKLRRGELAASLAGQDRGELRRL